MSWKLGDDWRDEILDLGVKIFSSACKDMDGLEFLPIVVLSYKAYMTDYIQGTTYS